MGHYIRDINGNYIWVDDSGKLIHTTNEGTIQSAVRKTLPKKEVPKQKRSYIIVGGRKVYNSPVSKNELVGPAPQPRPDEERQQRIARYNVEQEDMARRTAQTYGVIGGFLLMIMPSHILGAVKENKPLFEENKGLGDPVANLAFDVISPTVIAKGVNLTTKGIQYGLGRYGTLGLKTDPVKLIRPTKTERASKIFDDIFDRQYFKAIASGDPKRILAVRNLHFKGKTGINDLITQYHNTPNQFFQFKIQYPDEVFFHFDPNLEAVTKLNKNGNILSTYLKVANPLEVKDPINWNWSRIIETNPEIGEKLGFNKYLMEEYYNDLVGKLGSKEEANRLLMDRLGHDSFIYKNDTDFKNIISTSTAVPTSNLIKLADAITRDNLGNIIPISKRDNFLIEDFRYKQGGKFKYYIPKCLKGGKNPTAATLGLWWKGTWSYLSGHKDKDLMESKYRPSRSSDSTTKYYTRKGLDYDVMRNLLGGIESSYTNKFGEPIYYKSFDDLYNRLNNKSYMKGREVRNTDNSHLGDYTVSVGEDENGRYVSYYDKFDWSPIESLEVFHPYEIYNRIYEKDFNRIQKELSAEKYRGSNPSGNKFFSKDWK